MVHTEALTELAGQSVVLTYSNLAAEYEALRRRAIVVNRSHRARTRFTGDKAGEVLTGLLTNDVTALAAGQGQYAAALNAKGKVIADLRVLRLEDGFLTDASPRARDGWNGIVRKFVNPRQAKYADESGTTSVLGVFGVQARYVVEQLTGIGHSALALLTAYSHVAVETDGARSIVMRVPDLELEGYELFVPTERFQSVWDAAVAARATPAGLAAWEVARVEAGRPEYGVDMDDATVAQEANLEELGAISYTKGCYTGQEVVARVHFRGHVNRALRGLRASGTAAPPTGASIFDATGKAVGDVRSSVTSPRLGGIALGMVRREIADGAQLIARWSEHPAGDASPGELQVDVVPIPFPLQ
ncbi:MAG: YgfZ/GcvT domain-containing protein [Gemmatimonadaceae bacterium]